MQIQVSFRASLPATLAATLISAALPSHADDIFQQEVQCPSELVNFWSSYARKSNNLGSIPAFLIDNDCISKNISLDFHSAMERRFDEPDNVSWQNAIEEAYQDSVASL